MIIKLRKAKQQRNSDKVKEISQIIKKINKERFFKGQKKAGCSHVAKNLRNCSGNKSKNAWKIVQALSSKSRKSTITVQPIKSQDGGGGGELFIDYEKNL